MDVFEKILAKIDNGIKTIKPLMGGETRQIAESQIIGLEEARKNLIPLSRTMKEEIDALRSWAMSRARIANTPDEAPQEVRKIRSVARKPLTPAK